MNRHRAASAILLLATATLASPAMAATQTAVERAAIEDLAERLGIGTEEIEVRSLEAVTWPDASLGCPEEGMMYAQVLTPGSRIELAVGDRVYAYHAAEGRDPFLCPRGAARRSGPTLEQLSNTTYHGVYEQPVRLWAGRYEGEPFEPGGASRPTLTMLTEPLERSDLDGDGSEEAIVLLVESSGGSGSFVYLAVVGLVEGDPRNLATALVGDRVRIVSLEADGALIRARFLPGPAASSTDEVVREWELTDGGLAER